MERKENGREEKEFQRQMPDLSGSSETNLMTQLIDHNCTSESEENSIKIGSNGVMRRCREEVNGNLIDLHKGLTETTRDKVKTKEKIEWLTEAILFALVHMKNDNFVKSLMEWAKKKYDERVVEALARRAGSSSRARRRSTTSHVGTAAAGNRSAAAPTAGSSRRP